MVNSINDNPRKILHRSEGITQSEKYLNNLCERTFLRLWSFPGVYRDQSSGGGTAGGKEVCDLLVVFDEHIIIFSDKDCIFPSTNELDLDWRRWFKKAVLKSAKQLYGAERWIKTYPDRLFIDRKCRVPFPIELPNLSESKFHRVLIAHGVSNRCREVLGGSGSLMIHPGIIGNMHLLKVDEGGTPFAIGQIDPKKGFIHILDDVTIDVILTYLDTITDFVAYLEKKEKLIESGLLLAAAGEEDLLGFYLEQLNDAGEHDFIIPADKDWIVIDEGFWVHFLRSPERKAQLEANRISYSWDALIEQFSTHAMDGTQYFAYHNGIKDTEKIMRFMARENRTQRRMLSKKLLELLEKHPKDYKATRVMLPTKPKDPYYIFLLLPHVESVSEEEYREVRISLLEAYCMITKLKFPDASDIIGIATESGTDLYRSEDALYLDCRSWTIEQELEAKSLQEDLGLLKEVKEFASTDYEFPFRSKSARRRQQRKKRSRR